MAWIITPLPRTAMPTMRSPGIGLQQGAGCATWPVSRPMTTGAVLVGGPRQGGVAQQLGVERGDQLLAGHLGGAEPGQHVVGLLEAEAAGGGLERLVGRLLADALERDAGDLAAEPDLGRALLAAERAADRGLGAAGDHHVLPRRLRPLALGADDGDRLAVAELGPERHPLAVDLGADAAVADAGVDGVGEVDRRGAARELHHLALRGEAEDLVGNISSFTCSRKSSSSSPLDAAR